LIKVEPEVIVQVKTWKNIIALNYNVNYKVLPTGCMPRQLKVNHL